VSTHNQTYAGPVWRHLHAIVYLAIVGLLLWFVVSAWEFFDRGAYVGLLLAVVTGFFVMVTAVPSALFQTWRNQQSNHAAFGGGVSWRRWLGGEFETFTGRRTAVGAAVEVLLPLAAVALGITGIGLVFHFVALSTA
jgi:hypothetical protein